MSTPADTDGALRETRPTAAAILAHWRDYFADPMLSLASLRQEAEEGRLQHRGLRSLTWRFFFDLLPAPTPLSSTPTSESSSTLSTYSLLLSQSRSAYSELRERYLRAPDGRWVRDGEDTSLAETAAANGGTSGGAPSAAPRLAKVEVKGNNPLGLDEENPWKLWFADLELRKTIRQDVLRTFPDVEYFRSVEVQNRLTDVLFIFCKLTPQIGYRQGMHELLAPLLWLVDFDSLEPTGDETSLPHVALAREFVEHDTWALFSALMKSAKVYYDHSASAVASPSKSAALFPPPAPTSSSPPLVQPVVAIASQIHSTLSALDPELHAAFTRLQIEPQIYAIRWLRLLFSREFPLSDTMRLWDGLFARDTSLQLANHVCIAMLVRVRNSLLRAAAEGYGEFIQVLLRYPACDDGQFRTPLLLQQALYLRDNLSPGTAAHLVKQNIDAGAAVGEPIDAETGAPTWTTSQQVSPTQRRPPGASSAQGLGFLENGLVGDLAKGVYGRAEALGINKALRGTFDEIKRTMAEAQAQAEERRRLNAYSQIPARPPWDPQRSPPPPPVIDKDTLADLASLRAASLAMSEAVDICVTVLERTLAPPEKSPPAGADHVDEPNADTSAAQMMALTALRHVRDVLGGQAPTFDRSVLQPLKETGAKAAGEARSSSSTPEEALGAGSPAPPAATGGPANGLGAGFARLSVSQPPRSATTTVTRLEGTSSPQGTWRSEEFSYPPTSVPPPAAAARAPHTHSSPHPASVDTTKTPQAAGLPGPTLIADASREEVRRPFDPLGVL